MNKLQVTIFVAIILIFGIVIVITQSATLGLDKKEDEQISLDEIPQSITLMPSQQQSQLQTPQESALQAFNKESLEQYKTASATGVSSTTYWIVILVIVSPISNDSTTSIPSVTIPKLVY